jgi:hypothetical protein
MQSVENVEVTASMIGSLSVDNSVANLTKSIQYAENPGISALVSSVSKYKLHV